MIHGLGFRVFGKRSMIHGSVRVGLGDVRCLRLGCWRDTRIHSNNVLDTEGRDRDQTALFQHGFFKKEEGCKFAGWQHPLGMKQNKKLLVLAAEIIPGGSPPFGWKPSYCRFAA